MRRFDWPKVAAWAVVVVFSALCWFTFYWAVIR